MPLDFMQLTLKINYNNTGVIADPNEQERGWREQYDLVSAPSSGSPPINLLAFMNAGYAICAARAAVLASNFYIYDAEIHQFSKFKSRYLLPGFAKNPIFDNQIVLGADYEQPCNDPENALLVRFESVGMRRWQRAFRGIKDYVSQDDSFALSDASFGPNAGFDTAFPAVIPAGLNGAVETVITFTNTGGVLSAPVNAGSLGSGYGFGTLLTGVPLVINDPAGTGGGAYGTCNISAAGTVLALDIIEGGEGYSTATTIRVPITKDAKGIAQYLSANAYWANLYATLALYTGSGQRVRVPVADVPGATNPSGFVTQLNNDTLAGMYPISRVLPQKIGNRQTGRINIKSKGRVKRGI